MHHVGVEFVNMNKEVLEGGDFEVCGSRLLGTGWGGVTAFRQWYVGCGGHGVRGAVLYGGWVERMLGERVVIWWFGGGGGAACGNGGVMRVVRMVSVLAGILVGIRGDVSRVGGDVGGVNLAEGVRESSAKVMCRRVGCESLCGRDDAWVVGVL